MISAAAAPAAATPAQVWLAAAMIVVTVLIAAIGAGVRYGKTAQGLTTRVDDLSKSLDDVRNERQQMGNDLNQTLARLSDQMSAQHKEALTRADTHRESTRSDIDDVRRDISKLSVVCEQNTSGLAALTARVTDQRDEIRGQRDDLRDALKGLRDELSSTRDRATSADTKAQHAVDVSARLSSPSRT